jgi:hexosaminidase
MIISPFRRNTPLYISASSARNYDVDGLTLIPPTALDFAQTFSEDLSVSFYGKEFYSRASAGTVRRGEYTFPSSPTPKEKPTRTSLGEPTSEGYELVVTKKSGLRSTGSGSRGIWWGTRTLLQQLVLYNGKIPEGHTRDAPAYETRGYMLDAGRKWYSTEVCLLQIATSLDYILNRGSSLKSSARTPLSSSSTSFITTHPTIIRSPAATTKHGKTCTVNSHSARSPPPCEI